MMRLTIRTTECQSCHVPKKIAMHWETFPKGAPNHVRLSLMQMDYIYVTNLIHMGHAGNGIVFCNSS